MALLQMVALLNKGMSLFAFYLRLNFPTVCTFKGFLLFSCTCYLKQRHFGRNTMALFHHGNIESNSKCFAGKLSFIGQSPRNTNGCTTDSQKTALVCLDSGRNICSSSSKKHLCSTVFLLFSTELIIFVCA